MKYLKVKVYLITVFKDINNPRFTVDEKRAAIRAVTYLSKEDRERIGISYLDITRARIWLKNFMITGENTIK